MCGRTTSNLLHNSLSVSFARLVQLFRETTSKHRRSQSIPVALRYKCSGHFCFVSSIQQSPSGRALRSHKNLPKVFILHCLAFERNRQTSSGRSRSRTFPQRMASTLSHGSAGNTFTTSTEYNGPFSCTVEELPALYRLLNEVFRTNRPGDMAREYKRFLSPSNAYNLRVMKKAETGEIVSHVGIIIRSVTLGGIVTTVAEMGAVATATAARNKGLASLLVRDAIQRAHEQGADIMLISGDKSIYFSAGAIDCGNFPLLAFTTIASQTETPALASDDIVTIRAATEADLDAIIALRQTQATRFLLTRDELAELFHSKFAFDINVDWWVVETKHAIPHVVAFGVVGQYIPPGTAETHIGLVEWGGAPQYLSTAVEWWLRHYHLPALLHVTNDPMLLDAAIGAHHQPHRPLLTLVGSQPFDGTVIVLDAGRLYAKARPLLLERGGDALFERMRVDPGERRMEFRLGGAKAMFEGSELAQLFFGVPPPQAGVGNALLANLRAGAEGRRTREQMEEKAYEEFVTAKVRTEKEARGEAEERGSELDAMELVKAIKRILPLPLLWYGLGYV